MEYVPRLLSAYLQQSSMHYPVVTVTGPRQSGKTTLITALWPEKRYTSLEDPDTLDFARSDPRAFLEHQGAPGLIIDEAQRLPELFSYLQGYADRSDPGRYVLSGSSNFLLMERIGQSLAGRTAVATLLPFSAAELGSAALPASWEELAFRGFFPRVARGGLPVDMFARDYLATYVERDVRMVRNIGDLSSFTSFVRLCAGRAGQLLNLSSLAADAGIAFNTAKVWLGLLQASWIVFLLQPWHANLSKRLVKSPKLYWHDTGLLCGALGIRDAQDLRMHAMRGPLFENLVISERYKAACHSGRAPDLYFWRDSAGREVDLVEPGPEGKRIWECKAGSTFTSEFLRHLEFFGEADGISPERRLAAYGGAPSKTWSSGTALSWSDAVMGQID